MTSRAGQLISRSLAAILDRLGQSESNADDTDEFAEVTSGLEYFLPEILGEVYKEWKGEGLDGFVFPVARKTGPGESEFIGLAILISDQTVTPVHICLQVSTAEIVWLECRLGEPGSGKSGLARIPWGSRGANKWIKRLVLSPAAPDIDWVYRIRYDRGQG